MPDSASLHRIKSCAETPFSTARRLSEPVLLASTTTVCWQTQEERRRRHIVSAMADRASLARAVYDTAHITGTFRLRSGVTSNEYFDKYLFEADPGLLRGLATA